MPAYTANLLHQFTNSPSHQFTPIYQFTNLPIHQFTPPPKMVPLTHPLTSEGLGRKKLYWQWQILLPPSCFFVMSGSLALFTLYVDKRWSSNPSDVYLIRCLCFALTLALPKVIESKKTIKSCMKSPPWRGLFYLLGNLLLFNNLHLTFQIF